jgi:S1-C subfamily serine protease
VAGRSTSIPVFGVLAPLPYIQPSLECGTIQPRGALGEAERATVELFEHVSPSVVAVSVIVAPDAAGNIVTNAHVVNGAGTITIWLASGEDLDAEIVGVAPNFDLAVVRPKQKRRLPPAIAVGSSTGLKVGQSAYAIGSPYGLDQSLTTGAISGLKRELPTTRGHEVTNIIQTDTAIYPGNSGGPLLDIPAARARLRRTIDRGGQRLLSAQCAQYRTGICHSGRRGDPDRSGVHRQRADTHGGPCLRHPARHHC